MVSRILLLYIWPICLLISLMCSRSFIFDIAGWGLEMLNFSDGWFLRCSAKVDSKLYFSAAVLKVISARGSNFFPFCLGLKIEILTLELILIVSWMNVSIFFVWSASDSTLKWFMVPSPSLLMLCSLI